jgi:hypothetical protein
MTRSLIVHPRVLDAGRRLREFLRIDRAAGLHPAARALHVRVQDNPAQDARTREYLRIARGRTV